MAPASNNGIIYTPAQRFFRGLGQPSSVDIDLANSGVSEFQAEWLTTEHVTRLLVHPLTSGAQAAGSLTSVLLGARALAFGAKIGPSLRFYGKNLRMVSYTSLHTHGQWRKAHNLYLGLKFVLNGQTHYGWAEFSTGQQLRGAELQGYAYNTVPNQPIHAGEKGDLVSAAATAPKAVKPRPAGARRAWA